MDDGNLAYQYVIAVLENMSDDEERGFSDTYSANSDFEPEESNSDSEYDDTDLEVTDEEDSENNRDNDIDNAVPFANLINNRTWEPVDGDRLRFSEFPENTGVNPDIDAALVGKDPIDFLNYFIDEEIINLFVTETNRFAAQNIIAVANANNPTEKVQPVKWINTDPSEMRKFLGIIIWMDILKLTQLRDYWSTSILYQNKIPTVMSRNRFENILKMFHTCNNESQRVKDDCLYKISEVLSMIQRKFREAYVPEDVCINECIVPFRGRTYFRQYITNKRHRYGIKLIKLCATGGYTWAFKVYMCKEERENIWDSEKVITELMDGLFNSGRTLYTDKWYTSVSLADKMIEKKTHLVGTLRVNRKDNPHEVAKAKLKKGDVVARQNENKTVVLKWKDKRDVLMLSTKHDDSVKTFFKKGKECIKPTMVIDYNKGKTSIDLSDQMAAYAPYCRRTLKWYKRLLFHLITTTTIVNALYLFHKVNKKKMNITRFKEAIVLAMVGSSNNSDMPLVTPPSTSGEYLNQRQTHTLKEVEGQKRVTRKRCSVCYKNMKRTHNYAYARNYAKKVNTICEQCEAPMCLACFNNH